MNNIDSNEKREAGWNILKNQGLKAHRKKEYRNPRKKKRTQYAKAINRRRGQVRAVKQADTTAYEGELTGIRSNVSRSRKM